MNVKPLPGQQFLRPFPPFQGADSTGSKEFIQPQFPQLLRLFQAIEVEVVQRQAAVIFLNYCKGGAVDPTSDAQPPGQALDKAGLAGTQGTFQHYNRPRLSYLPYVCR